MARSSALAAATVLLVVCIGHLSAADSDAGEAVVLGDGGVGEVAWEDMEEESTMSQMDSFYSKVDADTFEWWFKVADTDYVELVARVEWPTLFGEVAQERDGEQVVRVLDVGCGSGKFPSLLHARLQAEGSPALDVSYLDLSDKSLGLMEGMLREYGEPFRVARPFRGSVVELPLDTLLQDGGYDFLYAVHSMYSFTRDDTPGVVTRLQRLLRPGGRGAIYALGQQSFYTQVHIRHARHVARRPRAIWTTSEDIEYGLQQAGVAYTPTTLHFNHTVPGNGTDILIKYLSKASMYRMTLEEASAATPYWDFVQSYFDQTCDCYQFPQVVTLLMIEGAQH